jgi:hypothetical protein
MSESGSEGETQQIELTLGKLDKGVEVETEICYELIVPPYELLAYAMIPAECFAGSFVRPSCIPHLKQLELVAGEWPGGKLLCWGTSSDGDPEAMAKAVHALVTNDPDVWVSLDSSESWGLELIEELLIDLGYEPGSLPPPPGEQPEGEGDEDSDDDGQQASPERTPEEKAAMTKEALEKYQKAAGISESGEDDAATRKQLYTDYLARHPLPIEAGRFLDPAFAGGDGAPEPGVLVGVYHPDRAPVLPRDECPGPPPDDDDGDSDSGSS